jgi:hypothetical protein
MLNCVKCGQLRNEVKVKTPIIILLSSILWNFGNAKADEAVTGLETSPTEDSWPVLRADDGDNHKYKGVATFDSGGYNCTSFLLQPPVSCRLFSNQKAIMLTNGHCTKSLDPNGVQRKSLKDQRELKLGDPQKVLKNKTASAINFKFGDFSGAKPEEIVNAKSAKILYATMMQQDLAVIELDTTYGQLESQGVRGYSLASSSIPQNITTVGRPIKGVPANEHFQRKASCHIEKKVAIIEAEWSWPNSIATNCPAQSGASGSPMFNDRGEVVGILNTGSTVPGPASSRCVTNSPCEVNNGDAQFIEGKAYGSEVGSINNCFDGCTFNPLKQTCSLPKESALKIERLASSLQKPNLGFKLPEPYTHAKYKFLPVGSDTCDSAQNYKETNNLGGGYVQIGDTGPSLFPDRKGTPDVPEGHYQLCVMGGIAKPGGEIRWEDPRKSFTQNMRIDRTPPEAVIDVKGGRVRFKTKDPADVLDSGVVYKVVTNIKECKGNKGYQRPMGIGPSVPTPPQWMCAKAQDSAGNWQVEPTILKQ